MATAAGTGNIVAVHLPAPSKPISASMAFILVSVEDPDPFHFRLPDPALSKTTQKSLLVSLFTRYHHNTAMFFWSCYLSNNIIYLYKSMIL